jgi:hypothetical protein
MAPRAGLSEGQVPSVTKPAPFVTDDGEGRRTLSTGQPRAPLCTVGVEQMARCNEIEAVTKRALIRRGSMPGAAGPGGPRSDRSRVCPLSTGAGASSRPWFFKRRAGGLPPRRTPSSQPYGSIGSFTVWPLVEACAVPIAVRPSIGTDVARSDQIPGSRRTLGWYLRTFQAASWEASEGR